MVSVTLLVEAVLASGMAALFGYVALVIRRRRASGDEARQALLAFMTWWAGLSFVTGIGAVRAFFGALGVLDVALHRGLTYLALAPLAAALWGLVSYLVYVQTGSPRWRIPILAFHVALGVFFLFLVAWLHPIGVTAETWRVETVYENALSGPLLVVTTVALLGPALLSAALYFTLFFRIRDPVSRYRIGMVAGAILVWFGVAALAGATHLNDVAWWPPISRAISLVATVMILFAYQPPRPWRLRLERRRARMADAPSQRVRQDRLAPPDVGGGAP